MVHGGRELARLSCRGTGQGPAPFLPSLQRTLADRVALSASPFTGALQDVLGPSLSWSLVCVGTDLLRGQGGCICQPRPRALFECLERMEVSGDGPCFAAGETEDQHVSCAHRALLAGTGLPTTGPDTSVSAQGVCPNRPGRPTPPSQPVFPPRLGLLPGCTAWPRGSCPQGLLVWMSLQGPHEPSTGVEVCPRARRPLGLRPAQD